MNKTFTWIIVVIILVVGAFVIFKHRGVAPTNMETGSDMAGGTMPTGTDGSWTDTPGMAEPSAPPAPTSSKPVTKEFTVNGGNFAFDPKEIKVAKGTNVVIHFKNANGMHDWVIDEFGARTKVLQSGQEETISFIADKTGTFEYYCSVGSHRKMGMVGNLVVTQ